MTFPRRAVLLGGVLLAAVTFAAGLTGAAAADKDTARAEALIQSVADEGLRLLNDKQASPATRVARFKTIFNRYFAVDAISRWVLGRHWNRATDAEKAEYRRLFEELITYGYVKRFSEYSGETLRILNTSRPSDNTAIVNSEIDRPGGSQPVDVDWRVGIRGDEHLITDVVVENVSLAQTWRSDFAATIQQGGGSVASLLDSMRKRIATLRAEVEAQG
jgi:phospholipid transport system substrate-binding protein